MRVRQIEENKKNLLWHLEELMRLDANYEQKNVIGAAKEQVANFCDFLINELTVAEKFANGDTRMTAAQRDRFWDLCSGYNVPFREDDYFPTQFSDSSPIMYEGWIGGGNARTIYVGVEPNGDSHS